MSSCVEEIFLFQKKLNKYARLHEADKVLYYLHKLNHLNVTVSHLEETGVGKTVNALRHQGGKVGEKARGLVNKWKAMVTAEEEEEEEEEAAENEEGLQARAEVPAQSRDEKELPDQEEEEEEEEDEEENCLQIEENNNPMAEDYDDQGSDHGLEEEPQPATSVPHSTYSYSHGGSSGSEGEDTGDYNPLTSRRDYQAHMGMPVAEYHPSTLSQSPREASSPEWGGASPGPAKDWKNGTSAKSPGKKSSREEKDQSREREKHRNKGKGKHRDSSSSHERERKKDKNRDKHREREEMREEAEDEKRSKSHKDKHRDREKHHARSRESKHRGDDNSEQSKYDKESEASAVNGFNTPDHKDRGFSSKRESRESERNVEERQRERMSEGHYQSGESSISRESAHQNRLAERTKPEKEKHRESSKKEKHKREHRDKDESPDRQKKEKKSKHHAMEDEVSSAASNSVNRDSRGGERTAKEGKGKHKENKHKHKESGKKDKHKRDSHSKQEVEEQERNKKERKSKQQTSMDSGFGAVLMGLDSPVKKKKKKRKKEADKERDSCSEEEQPSTSAGHKRGHTSDGGTPDTKKPKLLSSSVDRLPKLPPTMVPDEKPLLPEITPNYKPLPRLPIKEEPPESCLSKMTEEEALNFVFQSKSNRRSKVYSGKVCGLSYVPSLYETCIRVLQENIDALEYTGGIPFEILRPVLERATAKQLLNLQDYNHYLLQDSDVLWEVHCKRDFKKMKPEEMESWREMWIRCSDERDRRLKSLTHNLTEKFRTKAEPKRTTKIAYVDTAAKVPKSVARAQAKYGTAAASALAAKPGKGNEVAARKTAMQNVQRAERAANPRPVAAKKKKVAPLMAKTKQFFKKAFRR